MTSKIYTLAGVNGSGKSSIGGATLTSYGVEYYNPDIAAQKLREIHPNMTQYIANSHAWILGREMLENVPFRANCVLIYFDNWQIFPRYFVPL